MYSWNWEPTLLIGLVLQVSAYLLCVVGPLRRYFPGSQPAPQWQIQTFLLGWLMLASALITPLHTLGDTYLLTAHMIQHLLLALIAPPLMLIGTPEWLFRPAVTLPYIKNITLPIGRFLTHPLVAFLLFNLTFSLWHVPRYYDAALRNEMLHALEHMMFFGTAVLTWWPIFSPMKELPRLPQGGQVLYLFIQSLPPTILGAIISFVDNPLYAKYTEAPRVWGLDVMADQQLGGLTMWVPGGLIFFIVLTIVFFRWFGRDDDDYWEYDTASEQAARS
jgi:putative membrane protein